MIKKLSIKGYRGFGDKQEIEFAIPNGKEGSGLTFLVGGNNSGKTSILEAIKAFNQEKAPSFSIGKRNNKAHDIVELFMHKDNEEVDIVKTVDGGGSETNKKASDTVPAYILPSRRFVDYQFGKTAKDRRTYLQRNDPLGNRESTLYSFPDRLFHILNNSIEFDEVVERILGHKIVWTIDQNDGDNYFIKYIFGETTHNSEGIGDGIWSIFTIADALYDSPQNDIIAIDEPELSLHPAYQKRLMNVLMEYSKDRQIILSTHSPYFVNWEAIANGANLIRTVKDENFNIQCYMLSEEFKKKIAGFLDNLNNPHILGLSATEAFFLEDRIILVEGQEDVVIFNRISEQIGQNFIGEIFGWGVGGAPNMDTFLNLFNDLGYKKVTAIFDNDKKGEAEALSKQYNDYKFVVIPTDDIRDKEERTIKAKSGLTTKSGELKADLIEEAKAIINNVNEYMRE